MNPVDVNVNFTMVRDNIVVVVYVKTNKTVINYIIE